MANIGDLLGVGVFKRTGSTDGGSATTVGNSTVGVAAPGNYLIVNAGSSDFYGINLFNGSAVTLYCLLFDSTTLPANGACSPVEVFPVLAGSFGSYRAAPWGDQYINGVVAAMSTTWGTAGAPVAGVFTLTLATTYASFFSAKYRGF